MSTSGTVLTTTAAILAAAVAIDRAADATDCTQLEAPIVAAGTGPGDEFGSGIAMDGDVAVMGAWRRDDGGIDSGAAFVFERIGDTWVEVGPLPLPAQDAWDYTGTQVAMDGDTILVASRRDDGVALDAGAVHVFERIGGEWQFVQSLRPADLEEHDHFGQDLAIDGDVLVASAINHSHDGIDDCGAAWVYERVGGVWEFSAKLVAPDASPVDEAGLRVALDGDTIAVSSWYDDDGATNTGSVNLYRRDGAGWPWLAKVTRDDAEAGDRLGHGLAIEGDLLVVGAKDDMHFGPDGLDGPRFGGGSVSIFQELAPGDWQQVDWLAAPEGDGGEAFGFTVSLDGDAMLIGAPYDDTIGVETGAAYLYEQLPDGSWRFTRRLTPADLGTGADSRFGERAILQGDAMLVSAIRDATAGFQAGAVHAATRCTAADAGDVDGSGAVDFLDLLAVLGAWGPCDDAGDCPADLDGDGMVGFTDVVVVLGAWD